MIGSVPVVRELKKIERLGKADCVLTLVVVDGRMIGLVLLPMLLVPWLKLNVVPIRLPEEVSLTKVPALIVTMPPPIVLLINTP